MFYNMFFIFFCIFFAFYLVVSKLFTNFAAGNQIVHDYDAMGNRQRITGTGQMIRRIKEPSQKYYYV